MNAFTLRSPAKVNLILEIKGKRPDGFHDLKTVMHSLTLADVMSFKPNNTGLKIICSHPQVPNDERNLAYQAALRLSQAYGIEPKVTITIKKNIPVAAGMGGGSSNAATALLGLAKMWEIDNKKKILSIAKSLGSDVPFFLSGGCQLGIGRGDRLYKWPQCEQLKMVVVNPGFSVSTAKVYKNFKLGLTRKKACINMMRQAVIEKNAFKISKYLFNHLALVTEKAHPEVVEIKNALISLGATAALMTGSGPTVFGLVSSDKIAHFIYQKLVSRYPFVAVTSTGVAYKSD